MVHCPPETIVPIHNSASYQQTAGYVSCTVQNMHKTCWNGYGFNECNFHNQSKANCVFCPLIKVSIFKEKGECSEMNIGW